LFFKIIDFSRFSSIKIGQPTEVLIVEKGDAIPNDRLIIGHANNLLISPAPPPLMMLSKEFSFIELKDNRLTIGGATPTGKIISFAKRYNLAGFEFISKLPGSLGGMVAMNAGVKSYEVFNILDSVQINGKWIKKEYIKYGYRFANLQGVVTAAKFKKEKGFNQTLLEELQSLRSNQPQDPSAGSAFKNPKDDYAGRLIEEVGLKGYQKGGMAWSKVHSNFLVNLGDGTFDDAKYLIDLAKKRVFDMFKIELEEEIIIL
jgi:UDP-N-acetylmuramate dehydrogenase